MFLARGETERDFSNFLVVPTAEENHHCYEAFYDTTSNSSLSFRTCPVCAREKLEKEGEDSLILSDPSIVDVLTTTSTNSNVQPEMLILRHLLNVEEGGVSCWLCLDCLRSLERHILPKLLLANNLWIGEVPLELSCLTVPEQLLIARHYPRCYIFKLYPRDIDAHIAPDQLYTGMAGNATLFELNTQEVVEMLNGQRMPSPVRTLASVIAITFVSKRKLPMDWLKKTFRVRREAVHDALLWLKNNNPIYADINIDQCRLAELPEDDVPEELLAVVRQEEDEDLADKERESYLVEDDVENEVENEVMVNDSDGVFKIL